MKRCVLVFVVPVTQSALQKEQIYSYRSSLDLTMSLACRFSVAGSHCRPSSRGIRAAMLAQSLSGRGNCPFYGAQRSRSASPFACWIFTHRIFFERTAAVRLSAPPPPSSPLAPVTAIATPASMDCSVAAGDRDVCFHTARAMPLAPVLGTS